MTEAQKLKWKRKQYFIAQANIVPLVCPTWKQAYFSLEKKYLGLVAKYEAMQNRAAFNAFVGKIVERVREQEAIVEKQGATILALQEELEKYRQFRAQAIERQAKIDELEKKYAVLVDVYNKATRTDRERAYAYTEH